MDLRVESFPQGSASSPWSAEPHRPTGGAVCTPAQPSARPGPGRGLHGQVRPAGARALWWRRPTSTPLLPPAPSNTALGLCPPHCRSPRSWGPLGPGSSCAALTLATALAGGPSVQRGPSQAPPPPTSRRTGWGRAGEGKELPGDISTDLLPHYDPGSWERDLGQHRKPVLSQSADKPQSHTLLRKGPGETHTGLFLGGWITAFYSICHWVYFLFFNYSRK